MLINSVSCCTSTLLGQCFPGHATECRSSSTVSSVHPFAQQRGQVAPRASTEPCPQDALPVPSAVRVTVFLPRYRACLASGFANFCLSTGDCLASGLFVLSVASLEFLVSRHATTRAHKGPIFVLTAWKYISPCIYTHTVGCLPPSAPLRDITWG